MRRLFFLRFFLLWFLMLGGAFAQSSPEGQRAVVLLQIKGAIGPGVGDYLVNSIEKANLATPQAELILLTLDTPGGLVSSLRIINQAILASDVPVACLVHPAGARAASAGTYMLYACHIAAMAPATTLGAATPVQIGAPSAPNQQQDKPQTPDAMQRKILEDSIAYIRSLAQLRGRNAEWAEKAVRDAATLTSEEAVEQQVVDLLADNPLQLVDKLRGREVQVNGQPRVLQLDNYRLVDQQPDWRNKFITTITDPNVAYILMLLGIYGLLLEFYSPGIGVAGVVGAISLLLALYAFQALPLNFAGVGLLLLGIGLLIAEAMVPSFGILGFGGVVAFVVGSIFLIDTDVPGYRVAYPLIAGVALFSVGFLTLILSMVWRTRHKQVVSGMEAIIGAPVEVIEAFEGEGKVMLQGECWQAYSPTRVTPDQAVYVDSIDGLLLHLVRKDDKTDNKGKADG